MHLFQLNCFVHVHLSKNHFAANKNKLCLLVFRDKNRIVHVDLTSIASHLLLKKFVYSFLSKLFQKFLAKNTI